MRTRMRGAPETGRTRRAKAGGRKVRPNSFRRGEKSRISNDAPVSSVISVRSTAVLRR